MKVYVGRWDLLPGYWEGINGLYEKSEEEIKKEVLRQMQLQSDESFEESDPIPGIYTAIQFEETFNGCHNTTLNGINYWIKIF